MLPNNGNFSYQHGETQWFPDRASFNYSILNPQKIAANSNVQHINTLDSTLKLVKSLKSPKEEVDLINLNDDFNKTQRNQFVDREKQIADYQIKMIEEFLSTTSNTNSQKDETFTPEQQSEFQRFFDKCESHSKSADKFTNFDKFESMRKDIYPAYNFNTNNNIERTKFMISALEQENIEENEKVNEDLIDEVLLEKNLEKHRLQRTNKVHISKTEKVETDKNFGNNNIMDQIILNNDIDFAALKLDDKDFDPASTVKNKTNNLLKFTAQENPKLQSQLTTKVNELVSKHNIKYLEPIQVDDKIFQKRSVLISDVKKLHLTQGPTLEEKSIVLPQIMKRLQERNEMLKETANSRQKLILDSGSSHYKHAEETQHVATKLSNNPSSFAPKANNLSTRSISLNSAPSASTSGHKKLENSMPTMNNVQNLLTNSSGLKTNEIGGVINQNIQNSSRFTPIEKIKAMKHEKDLSQSQSDFELWMNPRVLRPPEPLIEDCNKSRYVNYVASEMFRDFVNGK